MNARAAARGCLGPDIRCDVQDGIGNAVDAVTPDGLHVPGPSDVIPNPLEGLGETIAGAAADAWTSAMLFLWDAGLLVLRVVLSFADQFLTPDLRANGPGRDVYAYTLWIAGALVLVMAMIQLGVAAFRRDGKSLATVFIGAGQFVIVWSAWLGYGVALLAACSSLTRALMRALLDVGSWSRWDPVAGFDAHDITDGGVATVLGLLGMVLWVAALGHLIVLLARAAALLVLAATTAISAAGLVSDAGRSWFWKSLRWFHAAAFTPVLMVLVLGIGVQMATGVAKGLNGTAQQSVGTALPSVVLICISCVAPLALFKLLAFVDPGTSSGASLRAGISGLTSASQQSGSPMAGGSGSSSASATGPDGRTIAESGAEEDTSTRFTKAATFTMSGAGPIGTALGKGAGMVANIGARSAAVMSDVASQMGVGHQTYQPDFVGHRSGGASGAGGPSFAPGQGDSGGAGGDSGAGGVGGDLDLIPPPTVVGPPRHGPSTTGSGTGSAAPSGGSPSGSSGPAGSGGSAGASAGATPPPVVP